MQDLEEIRPEMDLWSIISVSRLLEMNPMEFCPTVIMDCTHSVQRPGGTDGKTGGDRRYVPMMAKAAKAFGANGWFLEVHPTPEEGLSDAANMLELNKLPKLIEELKD